jgi:hypothetical protein
MCRYRAIAIALLMFTLGVAIDSYLRAPETGITNCFGCSSLSCKVVFVADNPVLSLLHPLETINLFLSD